MSDRSVVDSLERIVFAGVAMTTVAIAKARPAVELTFPQWRVVVLLGAADGPLRISEVARRVGVTLPAMSRQLHRMGRRGLIDVAPDPRDRRASVVSLTAEGQQIRATIITARRARISELAAPLEGDDGVRAALDRAAQAMEAPA